MFRAFLILAAVFAATVCQAAAVEEIVIFKINTPGYYVIEAGKIVPFGAPTPTPEPEPQPEPTTSLTKAVVAEINKIAANNARHAAATKLGKSYEMLAGQTVSPAKAVDVSRAVVAFMLTSTEAQSLAGAVSVVNAALAKCTTDAAVSAVFSEAGAACVSTVPNSEAALSQMGTKLKAGETDEFKALGERYGIDWAAFMQMLVQFMTVILPIILQFIKTAAIFGQFILLA